VRIMVGQKWASVLAATGGALALVLAWSSWPLFGIPEGLDAEHRHFAIALAAVGGAALVASGMMRVWPRSGRLLSLLCAAVGFVVINTIHDGNMLIRSLIWCAPAIPLISAAVLGGAHGRTGRGGSAV
jgi:hypothetical protein